LQSRNQKNTNELNHRDSSENSEKRGKGHFWGFSVGSAPCLGVPPAFLLSKDKICYHFIQGEKDRLDQGHGFVWRYQDANNDYICQHNPLENNFRIDKAGR